MLEIATYCEVLVLCCQDVQVHTEAAAVTAISEGFTLACLNDQKTGFFLFLKSDI